MRRGRVVMMLKQPAPGRVKTRLARAIGTIAACWWMRHQLAGHRRRLGRDARFDLHFAVTPDRAARHWPRAQPQGRGDLGLRMARLLRGRAPVLVVGGDIPDLTGVVLAQALRLLKRRGLVFGPTPDGGFWAVGWAGGALPHRLFQGARWSTSHALRDCLASAGTHTRISFAPLLADVDDADDYQCWRLSKSMRGSIQT